MIWLILCANNIMWCTDREQAIKAAVINSGMVVCLPFIYDGRMPDITGIPAHVCQDTTHCNQFGCYLYNEDGSRKSAHQSRHSVWDGEL